MIYSSLLAFFHHAAAFILFAVLTVELVLLKGELTLSTTRSLLRMDAAYGASAAVLLVIGFLRVFYTEKGAGYYFHSAPFIPRSPCLLSSGCCRSIRQCDFCPGGKA